VLDDGVIVGRIFKVPIAPKDRHWMWASGHNGDIRRAAHGYEPTRKAAMAGARQVMARGMIARDGKGDELAKTFVPALACALTVLDCRCWRVRLEARTRLIVFAVQL
jgi:hypothetical protein